MQFLYVKIRNIALESPNVFVTNKVVFCAQSATVQNIHQVLSLGNGKSPYHIYWFAVFPKMERDILERLIYS